MPITPAQLAARQALIDSMAEVSIVSPEQMADMVLDGLEGRGYIIIKLERGLTRTVLMFPGDPDLELSE